MMVRILERAYDGKFADGALRVPPENFPMQACRFKKLLWFFKICHLFVFKNKTIFLHDYLETILICTGH